MAVNVRRRAKGSDFKPIAQDTTYPLVDAKAIVPSEGGLIYKVRGFLNGTQYGLMFQYPNSPDVDQPDMAALATQVGVIIQYQKIPVTQDFITEDDWKVAIPVIANAPTA